MFGTDQRIEKERVVILSHFGKIYATHSLKLGKDQRREKREWLFLVILTRSMQLTR